MKFNLLLRDAGLDPADVKLVRHQDRRVPPERMPYELWRAGTFELYQRIQGKPRFAGAKAIASFVATPLDETLFVGLYVVKSVGVVPSGTIDPSTLTESHGANFYELEAAPALAELRGRLIIDWGDGFRAWVQNAANQDKLILEIRRAVSDPPFPGFMRFTTRLNALATVPRSWREALSSVAGVYLLTHPETGQQYVGSANGEAGFWGRWETYVASGHGGNKRMRDLPTADYHVTILEVAASSATTDELLRMEAAWKAKLLTRDHGLNAN
ncbi:MAG: GIY-YIG nuclease family protein [Verrucomicrobia bacterium]|nr:GIY-YIG nuclease family protein [Verrucomicrobiota bacterium]